MLPPAGLKTGRGHGRADSAMSIGIAFGFGGADKLPCMSGCAPTRPPEPVLGGYTLERRLFARDRSGQAPGNDDVWSWVLVGAVPQPQSATDQRREHNHGQRRLT